MSIIQVTDLTFAYEGSYDTIFENASFRFDTDWKLGFTGRNGRGKTTFLKLLKGDYPYQGKITDGVTFAYFPAEIPDAAQLTLHVLEEVSGFAEEWRLRKELSLLDTDPDELLYRPFETLSGGEQTKCLLAALFLKEGCYLLIDEPTNHLDMEGRQKVGAYLQGKQGFLLVSHDRAFLDDCCDHILYLGKAKIEIQQGNYSSWEENRRRRDAYEFSQNEKLKKEIKRLDEASRRAAQWSDKVERTKKGSRTAGLRPDRGYIGARAAAMMQRSKNTRANLERAAEQKHGLLKDTEHSEILALHPLRYHSPRLAVLDHLAINYGGSPVCTDITFEIRQGERIALCGRNGSGKSSLLKLLLGEALPHTGRLETGSGLKISYLPQDTSFLQGDLRAFARQHSLDESLFKAILRKLDFPRIQFEKDISAYSGGQKKKVLLAKSLCEQAHLYLWDEPLNFVDLISREQIEELILHFCPTMLFVEHDRAFVECTATKVISL